LKLMENLLKSTVLQARVLNLLFHWKQLLKI
jgi:hypothetical protein